ncbi:MFS general substrate transporter [Macrolepiota fuliginosa MF-IS2]|uniref:MFS general substrate transporter n=1 Tax=Macrolepiota fuliginosa MF-IS2 TaxID=1400762 RepID=A0A9P6C211_9AGAR|nr:MFS general substrate transporter [Macrolepiota fuliginosa MF-IS2]
MNEKSPASTIAQNEIQQCSNTPGVTPNEKLQEERIMHKQPEMHEGYYVVHRSFLKSVVIVIVATLSMLVNTGNSTYVAISLPTIGKELNADPSLLQWIVSSYPLSSGCLLLVGGRLADIHGRKKAYLGGTFLLAAFTLGCGFSNNIVTLIILRGVQGIGAAATIPASLGILAHAFPPSRARSFAFAAFAAGAPVGAAFGIAIGGVLTQKTAKTWRSPFYMFTAINVLCLIGGLVSIDKDPPHPKHDRKVDWLGAFLVTAGSVMILFVLGEGESAPKKWATAYIIALLVIGVFLIGLFVWWQWFLEKAQNQRQQRNDEEGKDQERRGALEALRENLPPPLMKLSLWGRANGRFAVVMCLAFLTWSSFLAWTFWIQLYFQSYSGLTPLQTVLRIIPAFVTGLSCTAFVGAMASHTPMVVITTIGTMGTSLACILFAILNPKATYWAYEFPAMILGVLGADFVFTAGTMYIAKISLPHEQSLAGALFQTMTQLGTSAGVTISTVVFNRVTMNLGKQDDMIRGYRAAQWTCCAFGLCGALLSLVFFRGVGVPGHKKVKDLPSQQESGEVESEEKIDPEEDKEYSVEDKA